MNKILVTLATLAASAGIALAGSGQAQADPGVCWNGWLWTACVQGPGWVDWNPGGGGRRLQSRARVWGLASRREARVEVARAASRLSTSSTPAIVMVQTIRG